MFKFCFVVGFAGTERRKRERERATEQSIDRRIISERFCLFRILSSLFLVAILIFWSILSHTLSQFSKSFELSPFLFSLSLPIPLCYCVCVYLNFEQMNLLLACDSILLLLLLIFASHLQHTHSQMLSQHSYLNDEKNTFNKSSTYYQIL